MAFPSSSCSERILVSTRRSPANRPASRARRINATAIPVAAVIAAAAALPADAHPTGSPVVDAVVRMAAAAILVALGSRARRWTWFVLLGGVALLYPRPLALLLVVAGLVVAFVSTMAGQRRKVHGCIVTVIASVLLYRLPDHGDALLTAAAVAAACLPALWSGYRVLPRYRRRVVGGLIEAGLVAFGVVVVLFAVAAAQSRSAFHRGVVEARAGREAAQRGAQDEAVSHLDAAAANFRSGSQTLDAWWARPARLIPALGPQVRAMGAAAGTGRTVTEAAADAASRTDYRKLRAGAGRIDLARLRSFQRPVADLEASLVLANSDLREIDDTWLLAPLASQVDALRDQVGSARRDTDLAGEVLRVAPDLLGASGPRRYALWFSTPSEARELGGYLGSFGELTAVDGRLRLERTGRITDLLPRTEAELAARRFPGEAFLPTRYRAYDVPRFLGNATGTQDFGLAARTFAEVYARSGGNRVDGIIALDPYALAGILRLTGPVAVAGLPAPLTSANAANFLLREQYAAFGDRAQRADFLAEALRATFNRLTARPLPDPQRLAQTLSPLTRQRRLLAWSFRPEAQRVLRRVHLSGETGPRLGGDELSITNANANPNKIDAFLRRRIAAQVRFDPATGQTTSTVTVTMTNTAPAVDLPGGTTSNLFGLPPGTNRTLLTIASPLSLVSAEQDGRPINIETEVDDQVARYGVFVDLPPKATVRVRFGLKGTLRPSNRYRLTFIDQPLVNPDHLDVRVSGPARITGSEVSGPFRLSPVEGDDARYRGVAVGGVGNFTVRFLSQT